MAKLHEEIVVIKLSTLVRDDETATESFTAEALNTLEQVVEELTGQAHSLVEVIKMDPNNG